MHGAKVKICELYFGVAPFAYWPAHELFSPSTFVVFLSFVAIVLWRRLWPFLLQSLSVHRTCLSSRVN